MNEQPTPQLPPRGMPTWPRVLIALGVVAVVALLVTGGIVLPRLLAEQEANNRSVCLNNLRNIGLALLMYQDQHGTYPPAYIADAEGKPMHSWRVLILPFLEEQELYDQYRFDEPWNGPNNRKLADKDLAIFRCPSSKQLHNTSFLAVVDETTAWPGATGRKATYIPDGSANTIMLVESVESGIHWMEPRDLTLKDAVQGVNAESNRPHICTKHPDGATVL